MPATPIVRSCSKPSLRSRALPAPATRPPTGKTSATRKAVASSTPCIATLNPSKAFGSTRSHAISSGISATDRLAWASVIVVLFLARQKMCVIERFLISLVGGGRSFYNGKDCIKYGFDVRLKSTLVFKESRKPFRNHEHYDNG